MRILVLALALTPGAALAGDGPHQNTRPYVTAAHCRSAAVQPVRRAPAPVRAHPLAREPRAEAYLGVLHLENGCDKPIKVRDRR